HPLAAEQQDVHVDLARSPAVAWRSSYRRLDSLDRFQELPRPACPLHLDHLIQEARLVGNAERLRLMNVALAQQPRAYFDEEPPRLGSVGCAAAGVGAQPKIGKRLRPTLSASPPRATASISGTSWTRMMSAPRRMAAVTAAAVPHTRMAISCPNSLPRKDLRD